MKIGILTSSRADFGIYSPLLNAMKSDPSFTIEIIAFGAHVSAMYGNTIEEVEDYDEVQIHRLSTLLANDDEGAVATSYGLTVIKFADFWSKSDYDIVFCLGDRFEMNAAVQAGLPFGITFAHLHGGETTLGSLDNIYRHQISHAASLHFTSTEEYAKRVRQLTGTTENIFNVGALSLSNFDDLEQIDEEDFRLKFSIPKGAFVLVTFHPETVSSGDNEDLADNMYSALKELTSRVNLVITMPNADVKGSIYRQAHQKLKQEFPAKIVLVESFGRQYYFAAMQYASALLGNTSSGIIEAASFGKYVVNVGERQKGRVQGSNIIDVSFIQTEIVDAVLKAKENTYQGVNPYQKEDTVQIILNTLKTYLNV